MHLELTRIKLTRKEWERILAYMWTSSIVIALGYHLFWLVVFQMIVASTAAASWKHIADQQKLLTAQWETQADKWQELYHKSDVMYNQLHSMLFMSRTNVN